jgi:hypothetical protein
LKYFITLQKNGLVTFTLLFFIYFIEKSFASLGLPPLPESLNVSASPHSVNTDHEPAKLLRRKFNVLDDLQLDGGTVLWRMHTEHSGLSTYDTETDIVRYVILDAITALGLVKELDCINELSLFRLRADIWIVVKKSGVPVGVLQVKKHKEDSNVLNNENVHGQILDYMLCLKSFHGLQHIFGIVTTYSQWRIYWLPECDEVAAARSVRDLNSNHIKELNGNMVEDNPISNKEISIVSHVSTKYLFF